MNALGSILLLPVGHPEKHDVENLASDLLATGLVCTVGRGMALPEDAYDRRRNQYLANAFLGLAAQTAHALAHRRARVLAVTEVDLYADDLNFRLRHRPVARPGRGDFAMPPRPRCGPAVAA
jgi:predicted Zn-dependent protease